MVRKGSVYASGKDRPGQPPGLLPPGKMELCISCGIYDQEIKWSAFGINYYLRGQDLRLTAEYSINDYVKEDAANKDFKTITAMLQLRI